MFTVNSKVTRTVSTVYFHNTTSSYHPMAINLLYHNRFIYLVFHNTTTLLPISTLPYFTLPKLGTKPPTDPVFSMLWFWGATWLIWVKVFKNGPSRICGRQPLKTFSNGCLPQILLGPFLNTLIHMS